MRFSDKPGVTVFANDVHAGVSGQSPLAKSENAMLPRYSILYKVQCHEFFILILLFIL